MSVHVDSPANALGDRQAIDTALLRGAVMLTPHPRLARAESAAFDAIRHAEGARVWQPANVLPWRAWTASLWRDALVNGIDTRILLNDMQERALWEEVVRETAADTLRSTASLARLCAGAANLLGAFDLRGDFGRGIYHRSSDPSDADIFARWWLRFEARCTADGFLPAGHLDTALATHVRNGQITPQAEYLLHGFDTLMPAQQNLMDALATAGARIHRTSSQPREAEATLMACASPDEELAHCAAWARRALEQPQARVAIVVPDLDTCRPVLERALRATVAPELADVTATEHSTPFEFSTGRPLAVLAMIEDALRLLHWCIDEVSVDDAGAVLRSRFLSFAPTPDRGAELDAFILRDRPALRAVVSMNRVAHWLEKVEPSTASALRTVFAAARNLDKGRAHHAFFADGSRSLLRAAGWPSQSLSSEEHQAVDRWEETLDRVASLDALGHKVTFAEFIAKLSEAAQDTIFAPENQDAPLQVTTVAEAMGRDVDALWFLHADERTWPPRLRPHPLLPLALQRALGMPGADSHEDELASQRQLMRLLQDTQSAVFSYARVVGENTQRPAPLVSAIDGIKPTVADSISSPEQPVLLELVEDVAPLPSLPEGVLTGGVSVLSAQAECGFRAFAEKRLFSRELVVSGAGLTPGERGDHVHSVLEAFWKQVRDQEQLKRMSANRDSEGVSERDRLLMQCIDDVLRSKPEEAWETAYLDVQQKRLKQLLTAWLDFEAMRPPFRVEHIEEEIADAAVGPLHLKLRVDRVDRVTVGGEEAAVLIDYKTGSAVHTKAEWMGERLSQPQLPVYAIAGGIADVKGVAFGAVKEGKLGNRLEGLAEDPKMLSSRATASVDFDLQLETWRTDVTKLATDFASGVTSVDPKEYPKTCDQCGQRMLCRLDVATLLDLDDMDEDDEELPW